MAHLQSREHKKIALPRLKLLRLSNSLPTCLSILQRIAQLPAPCALQVSLYDANPESKNDLSMFNNIVKDYSISYFKSGIITELRLEVAKAITAVEAPIMVYPHNISGQRISFEVPPQKKSTQDASSSLMNSLRCCDLSSVTTLRFDVHGFRGSEKFAWNRDFLDFFLACPSVTVLQTSIDAAETLHNITNDHSTIFPVLHTLMLHSFEACTLSMQRKSTQTILRFLEQRRVLGVPIKLLDLSDCQTKNGTSACIEYWDRSAKVLVRRKTHASLKCRVNPAHPGLSCHGCGVALILNAQSGDFKPLKYVSPNPNRRIRTREGRATLSSISIRGLFKKLRTRYLR
ncbi:hypothetical protein CPB84DRAFT_653954 [Gymnopilus junonius]|uniref:Uncharacterized protein n=1 Tax=Gymnopilus junonius TaxID=109634 RepID=A0A9P5NSA1_GYMJU|nr:hypothetical protein CPB84DRAFT_653954 [Gymnopilus junonius]